MSKELIAEVVQWIITACRSMLPYEFHAKAIIALVNKQQRETLLACFVDGEKRMYTTDQVRAIIKRCG